MLGSCECSKQAKESGRMNTEAKRLMSSIDLIKIIKHYYPTHNLAGRDMTQFGLEYVFVADEPPLRFLVQIAVYKNETLAHDALERLKLLMAVGPTKQDRLIGDEVLVWETADPEGGSVLFRRTNAVIYLPGGWPFGERLILAERLDKAMLADTVNVEHADSVAPPEIVSINFPPIINIGQEVTSAIEVANIQPEEALFGTATEDLFVERGRIPTLTYYSPDEPGQNEIILFIGSPSNQISKYSITIETK